MRHWLAGLARHRVSILRLIAAAHGISKVSTMPHAELLRRLRVIGHEKTVLRLAAELQAVEFHALQELRGKRQGIERWELEARYGPLRSLTELARSRRPRTISERLLLLGWLVPFEGDIGVRQRYGIPAELHQRLPELNPALPAATTARAGLAVLLSRRLIAVSARRPLTAAARLGIRRSDLPLLLATLPPELQADAGSCLAWLVPLLRQTGLLQEVHGQLQPGPKAESFRGQNAVEQAERLAAAWQQQPEPEVWLIGLRVNLNGLNWPALSRRLQQWAMHGGALPYPDCRRRFGALVDRQTHPATVDGRRMPWTERGAELVWDAARRGPLRWLGRISEPAERQALLEQLLTASEPVPVAFTSQAAVIFTISDGHLRQQLRNERSVRRYLLSETIEGGWVVAAEDAERFTRWLQSRSGDAPAAAVDEPALRPSAGLRQLTALRRAIRNGGRLTFRYQGRDDVRARTRWISDAQLRLVDGDWRLFGICSEAQAERQFRLDRIFSRQALPEEPSADDQQIGQRPAEINAIDDGLSGAERIEPIPAQTVDCGIDQAQQPSA